MPINAHPDYLFAERDHLLAQTLEDKIKTLEKMISVAPKHKGAENLRMQLTTKLKKLKKQLVKSKKSGKTSKQGIKKDDMQAIILGETNTGKSSLLKLLTNAQPKIADHNFTTKNPIIGMMNHAGTQIQLIENPAIESEYYDKGLTNTTDTLIIIVNYLKQIEKINQELQNFKGKKIIVFNNKNNLNEKELRKLDSTLKSKKYNFIVINLKKVSDVHQDNKSFLSGGARDGEENTNSRAENLQILKEKIFKSFNKIRVYTKEPGKQKTNRPIILNPNSTVKDVAEKILHGFSHKVKETKITGPSSKFSNQKVGLQHKLKDLDIVEFKVK